MNFVNGRVLYAIPVVVSGVIWFLWWSWRKRQALSRLFVSERLLPQLLEGFSPARRKWKMVLQVAAVLFLMLALARPQWGFVWEEANQRGRDILVAIDTSRSMLATDMAPNRLARAKLAALDLMRLAKNDRLGLIAFAGAAFLQSPLTLDDEAFRQSVEALDTTIIPQGGTAITEAIQTAVTAFATEEGDNHKVLIIFTDGEDQDGGAQMAAEDADNHHLKIFTVGVGTPAGELIKIIDERGQSSYVKDEQGNVVKSRLNEDLLRQIATAAKGFYIPLREGNAMQVLYQQGLAPLPTSDISSKLVRHLNEQFQWPLGIAIALLMIEALLPDAPKKRSSKEVFETTSSAKAAVAAAMLLILFAPVSVQASASSAYRAFKQGRFRDARNEYTKLRDKNPDDPRLNYNVGSMEARLKDFDDAAKSFEKATRSDDLQLQESSYYNLGSANYNRSKEEKELEKKVDILRASLKNFESALKLDGHDLDAKYNYDLVKKELEDLEKKLKKQQQQQKNQDKNDNKDQNKDDKNQTDKNQQEQKKDQSKDKDNKDQKQDDQQKQEQKDNQDSKSDEQKKQEQQQREQQKKEQEQKEKEQQQQQQAQNDKKEGDRNDKPEAKNKGDQQQASDQKKADQQNEAEQEARAAQLAQMTPHQAQQMLDAQKSEEKALIYRQYDERKKTRNRIFKDW